MPYELGRQYEVWDCPFCGQNTISVIHFPKSVSIKRSKTASLPGSKGFHVSPDVYVVQSGCSKCGNSAEEVERKMKESGMI
jgi:transcription elongation factor Elf1